MKRCITLMMVLSLIISCLSPFTSVTTYAETTESSDESSSPAVIETDNECSEDNPIGDDASFYKMDTLKDGPDLAAESSILMDATTGAVLYSREAKTKRYPASITKCMTALLIIENCNLNDTVTFSNEAVNGVEGSSAGINVGAQLTVEDALYAMMLVSANEAAAALAEHAAGSIDAFADMMNKRAKELGCKDTHFTNPHGLPDENHYTTAYDMALILRQAMKYDEFRKFAGTITYTIEKSDTLNNTLELWNHSKILRENSEFYYKYAEGSKTGYTRAALNTLVTFAKKDKTELICVVLKDYGADSSYHDTKALFKWGFDNVKGIRPLTDVKFGTLISSSKDLTDAQIKAIKALKTSFNEKYYVLVPKKFDDDSIDISFELDADEKSDRLGYINISSDGDVIGKAPVTYEGTFDVSGKGDDLETAPNSDTSLRPHKVLKFLLKVLIAIVLIFIIMTIIRTISARRTAQRNLKRRRQARTRRRAKDDSIK